MKNSILVSPRFVSLLLCLCLLLVAIPSNAQVQNIIKAVSIDSLFLRLRELTGDLPVMIDGQQRTINTRTVLTTGNRLAAQYLVDQFKRLGLSVERQHFYGNYSNFPDIQKLPLSFVDLQKIGETFWMCSDWGEIFRSDDTCRTWKSSRPSGSRQNDRLDWICAADTSSLIALGKTGIQTATTDGGKTWTTRKTGFLNLVHAVNRGKTVLAICQNGIVWRSTNLGADWTKALIDTTNAILTQATFVSSSLVYVVGSNKNATSGRIFVSNDAGLTWSPVALSATDPLQSIFAVDPFRVWAASSGGAVYSTTSAGASWTSTQYGDTSTPANRIFFLDPANGWLSAGGNKLYRTTNGGTSWTLSSTFGSTMRIEDFMFLTPLRGILIGKEYSDFTTTDGGATWQDNSVPLLSNVIATLPGTTTQKKYVLVLAHYDLTTQADRSNDEFLSGSGADDDGTGTVALLELARVFAMYRLPIAMKFAVVPDEEWFGKGQYFLADKLLAEPDTLMAAVDLDMLGYDFTYPRGMSLFQEEDSASLDLCNRFVALVKDNQFALDPIFLRNGSLSDIRGFVGRVPVVEIIEAHFGVSPDGLNPNYHMASETWSALNGTFFREMVKASAAFLYDIWQNGAGRVPPPTPHPPPKWQSTWPPQGNLTVRTFATTPGATGVTDNVFLGTVPGGVFLMNSDTTWTPVNFGLTNKSVLALAGGGDGTGGTRLFAGTLGGVFLSTNNGANWSAVNAGLANNPVYALALSGPNLFAGTYGSGVYLSTNNGITWTATNAGISKTIVYSLVVSSSVVGQNVFAGTWGDGVFVSRDNGSSWMPANTGLPTMYINALAVVSDASSGNTVFVRTDGGGLFMSTDEGALWRPVDLGIPAPVVTALASTNKGLFVATSNSLLLLIKNGGSWKVVDTGFNIYLVAVRVLGASSTRVFACRGSDVSWRSLQGLITSVDQRANGLPLSFMLEQNYPNPFNPSTTISYTLPKAANVSLKIFNVLGQLVATLVDEKKGPGYHSAMWSPSVPSGIYLYRLQAGGFVETKKMILMK